ncbi:ATP-dependent DNA helicase homolog RECG, chloroplastic isoform X3 [Vitis riparia]|uniref:ATP-dependent DNA helicase homolog RECG, chloroplastic isoform X3 n=1 Tax=Vitis riparia TaxID=96939 RepID=UPI00155A32A2|nr:ATP-dependent DNA helicase homolog RECG, chloroplastic isoform X3 [Vitis riparia]
MALAVSVVRSCGMCCSEKPLRIAIAFEAERGYQNALGRKMRFSNFLLSKISKLCSRSKHKFPEKLLDEVDSYGKASISDRSKLLNKVSVLMGYDSLHDLIENERVQKESDMNLKDEINNVDISLACRKFPSIILGNSPPVELYDENVCHSDVRSLLAAQICEEFLSSSGAEKWDGPDRFSETWPSLCPTLPNINASLLRKESSSTLPVSSQPLTMETKEKSDVLVTVEGPPANMVLESQNNVEPVELILDKSISFIPGLQKRHCRQLENCGFHTLRKLLQHFPRTYADLKNALIGIDDGQYMISIGKILSSRGVKASCSFSFLEVVVGCEIADCESKYEQMIGANDSWGKKTIYLHLKKFFRGTRFTNVPFLRCLQEKHKEGDIVCVSGKVRTMRTKDHYEMREYNLDLIEDDQDSSVCPKGRPYSIYPSKGGLNSNFLRDIISRALHSLPVNIDPIPKDIIEDFGLLSLHSAYVGIHQPKDLKEADLARKRLIFDEFFYLQGDVGCGKTVVAFLACMEVIGSGYQAAFMVPTELLAVQHYEQLINLLENMEGAECKPSIALLTGSTPSKQSRMTHKGLQNGDISLVVGTHSLISEKVEFSALRIAVVDEQHRFGVIQRGRFNSKLYYNSISSRMAEASSDVLSEGDKRMAPHILAMSATPIPRTLALALYGDMSLTQITDLPPGRTPVETYTIEGCDAGFEDVYQMMLDELEAGGKIYIVYPVIEQSEQLPQLRAASTDLETISSRFQGYKCGLLHGRMKSDEKDEALRRFRSGETNILLSTQVIEIGVDVPDASMMVVMNAERFGIAQLHQLRGRVGRGVRKSKCLLVSSTAGGLNRMKVLENSSDGFYLANMDLLLRGPGDLLGKKQSGHLPEFPIARLEIDGNILQEAHLAALKILGTSHDLEQFPELKAELSMRQPLCLLGD